MVFVDSGKRNVPRLPGKTGFCRHCPARRGGSAQGTVGKRSLELLRVESVQQRWAAVRAAGGKWPVYVARAAGGSGTAPTSRHPSCYQDSRGVQS